MPPLPIAPPETIGLDPQRLQVAYDLLAEWTQGDPPQVGAGAIAVGRRGQLAPPRRFGHMRHGGAPIRDDALFLLASITKPIVYTAALQLVEQGKIGLTDRVTHYFPDFAAHHKDETLVLHLFTHTSGLPDMLDNNVELRKAHAPLDVFLRHAIRDTLPLFAPGTNVSYQSMGTLVVSGIVEKVTGLPIAEVLRRQLFEPLGLKSTALGSRGLDRERIVRAEIAGFLKGGENNYDWNSTYWQELGAPWGGMFSTVEEFAVICQMLLDQGRAGDKRLLSPAMVERLSTNRLDDLPGLSEEHRRTQPWGLGWRLNHPGTSDSWGDLLGPRIFGHTGATGTLVWIDPAKEGFCILFTNALRAAAPWRLKRLSNIIASAFV